MTTSNTLTCAGKTTACPRSCVTNRHLSQAISTLCSLRLTSYELAEMWTIRAALFAKIDLHATKENLSRLHQTNITKVFAPFVRSVTFYPSPYARDASTLEFGVLLLVQGIFERHPGMCHVCDYDPLETFKQFRGNRQEYPWTPDRFRAEQSEYHTRAVTDARLITTGVLQVAWTAAFSAFGKLESICLGSLSDRCEAGSFSLLHGRFPSRRDCCGSSSFLSRVTGVTGSCGDVLASAVAQCLVSSGRSVRSLGFGCELVWSLLPIGVQKRWDDLNLDGLQHLSFGSLPHRSKSGAAAAAVTCLLKKSHTTIQSFRYVRHAPRSNADWPRIDQLDFPCLRRLSLEGVAFPSAALATDVLRFESLTCLEISRCSPFEGRRGWKVVFNAIHRKSTALRLKFHQNRVLRRPWDLDFDTADEMPLESVFSTTHQDLERSLRLYLSNRGDWNATLNIWLP